MEGLKNTALRQRSPFIQSEKRAARRDSSSFKKGRRRLILNDYRHIIHAASESRGDIACAAAKNRLVFGVYRRHMKTIGYLGQIDKLFDAPATTRSWNTILSVLRILRATSRQS